MFKNKYKIILITIFTKKNILRGRVKLLSYFQYIVKGIVVYETKNKFFSNNFQVFLTCQLSLITYCHVSTCILYKTHIFKIIQFTSLLMIK